MITLYPNNNTEAHYVVPQSYTVADRDIRDFKLWTHIAKKDNLYQPWCIEIEVYSREYATTKSVALVGDISGYMGISGRYNTIGLWDATTQTVIGTLPFPQRNSYQLVDKSEPSPAQTLTGTWVQVDGGGLPQEVQLWKKVKN